MVVGYTYDQSGNRLAVIIDATAPTTTADPPGGICALGQTVTLTCNDGSGLGCDKIYYSTDGSTPSNIYSNPIPVSETTLKFFATDFAGHAEAVKTEIYTLDSVPPTGTIAINSGALRIRIDPGGNINAQTKYRENPSYFFISS